MLRPAPKRARFSIIGGVPTEQEHLARLLEAVSIDTIPERADVLVVIRTLAGLAGFQLHREPRRPTLIVSLRLLPAASPAASRASDAYASAALRWAMTCLLSSETEFAAYLALLSPNMNSLSEITHAVSEMAQEWQLAEQATHNLRLVIDELCTNIVMHGEFSSQPVAFAVQILRERELLLVGIRDTARAFNPLDQREPSFDVDLDDRPAGGLGIHLVKSIAKRIEYEYKDGENSLRVELDQLDAS